MSDDVLNLINRIGEKENTLTEREFVSPIFGATVVATRVSGVAYTFKIPVTKPGWYKIRPLDGKKARVVGSADLMETEQYLKLLEKLRLVVFSRKDDVYQGLPVKSNKYGLSPTDPLPVFLFDDTVMDFDKVICRYDGVNLWFETVDTGNDPAKAEYLRESMQKLLDPKKIHFPGLTFEEKAAYALRVHLDKRFVADRKKKNLKEDVEHAGGRFVSFQEKQDHFAVTFIVDGQRYTSHVNKTPAHNIVSAGICLSGLDADFDLKSLITVMREGQHRGLIHRW